MKKILAAAVVCLALFTVPAFAGVVVVGSPADVVRETASRSVVLTDGEYQQIYNSGQFCGPITITDLEFYNTQVDFGATAMNSGTWAISCPRPRLTGTRLTPPCP